MELLASNRQLEPLLALLVQGKGYSLDEFCANVKFQAPKLTSDGLLGITRSYVEQHSKGTEPSEALWSRVSKTTGPILSTVIRELGGAPSSRPADRKNQLKHYFVHHEFPVVIAKKKRATKKAAPTVSVDELVNHYEALKGQARSLGMDETDSRFDKLFARKGCTVKVLKEVLNRQNLDFSGTKKQLLDRLRRVPRTLASAHALESFS